MRYYRIILSISIFALFFSFFSISSKILAIDVTNGTLDSPAQTSVSTSPATTTDTTTPKTKEETLLDKIKSIFGNFLSGFFAKQSNISVENPASFTNFGNVDSNDTRSASDRIPPYEIQINYKNQYLKDIITGENGYQNLTLSSCSDDPNIHSVTLRELAAYEFKYNKISFNFSSTDEIQKKDDLLLEFKDTFDKFDQLPGKMYDSESSSVKNSLTTKEKVSFCYDQFYNQLWNIPQGNDGKSAAGSKQTNDTLRLIIPSDKQKDPDFTQNETDPSIKYLNDNKIQKENFKKLMTPNGMNPEQNMLTPDSWPK
jgi:hypothetical protein